MFRLLKLIYPSSVLANMAEVIAKRMRTNALSNFTRAINTFNSLVEEDAPPVLVKP